MKWIVGDRESIVRRWVLNGDNVTDGTAEVEVYRFVSTGVEWWHWGFGNWVTSRHKVNMTYDVDLEAFTYEFDVPTDFDDNTVHVTAYHDNPLLPPLPETNYVSERDIDDLSVEVDEVAAEELALAVWTTIRDEVDQEDTMGELMKHIGKEILGITLTEVK